MNKGQTEQSAGHLQTSKKVKDSCCILDYPIDVNKQYVSSVHREQTAVPTTMHKAKPWSVLLKLKCLISTTLNRLMEVTYGL